MTRTELLKQELQSPRNARYYGNCAEFFYPAIGINKDPNATVSRKRANGINALFSMPVPNIYKNDLIVGSYKSLWLDIDTTTLNNAEKTVMDLGMRNFYTNCDHFAPNYRKFVKIGIPGVIKELEDALIKHQNDPKKKAFIEDMQIAFNGFTQMIVRYIENANFLKDRGYDKDSLDFIIKNCKGILDHAPETFAEGLQLVWLTHMAFVQEGRVAMALGRIDQYLYPLFKKDIENGTLTEEFATELLENVFMKIYERRPLRQNDDVVNIAIGGQNVKGECEVNRLSYCVLWAVKNCQVPGPNLSARITKNTPDDFLDECLKSIGTGLGYPALMNDDVNIKGLLRRGYEKEDVYDYSMVGCIENFITGKQPPWTDGRFDFPKYFEFVFNHGKDIYIPEEEINFGNAGAIAEGIDQGDVSDIKSIDEFWDRYAEQLRYGVKKHMENFLSYNTISNPEDLTSPFLSIFCDDCIERGLDINAGGAKYPSSYGAGLTGIATAIDSLSAIEKVIFIDKKATLSQLVDAIKNNFKGYEDLRKLLIDAPKYGNNDDFADKYADKLLRLATDEFDKYHTPDGGMVYTLMASNTENVPCGNRTAATADGRLQGEPVSDAASPTYGKDVRGATATVNSISKPDYSLSSGGSVINQKFSPAMFTDQNRSKLAALIRTYFSKGGQEMQINATSREVLKDAMINPSKYPTMVVRVSGFSAIYITLDKAVQIDILNRTQKDM